MKFTRGQSAGSKPRFASTANVSRRRFSAGGATADEGLPALRRTAPQPTLLDQSKLSRTFIA